MRNKRKSSFVRSISLFITLFFITLIFFNSVTVYSEEIEYISQEAFMGIDIYDSPIEDGGYVKYQYNIPNEINNIVIFIKFKDDREYVNDKSFEVINDVYNGNDMSLKSYLSDLTYGRVNSSTTFYPVDENNKHYSYEAPYKREYYMKKTDTNLIGYSNQSEKFTRENDLLIEATKSVAYQVKIPGDKLDANGDGAIDNVTYVLSGLPQEHGDLLWPHKSSVSNTTYINGKMVSDYNVLIQGTTNTGVMGLYTRLLGVVVHEFLHTFYFPDLYRYNSTSASPVGKWDIMASTARNPQLPLAYTRLTYDGSENQIPIIDSDGEYILSPSNSLKKGDTIAYKIKSPLSKEQYFVVEFRRGNDKWDSILDIKNPGLLVYRINDSVGIFNGNKFGSPDHIYIFRPSVTSPQLADGNIDEAIISPTLGQTRIGKNIGKSIFDEDTLYFEDGSNSGIEIYDIKFTDNESILFKVRFPEVEGDGSKENPFIIRTAEQFSNIRNNSDAYYKLASDIDMSIIPEFSPIRDFNGVLDGQGHTISNININSANEEVIGIFNNISQKAIVKNINFTDVNIVGKRMVGGLTESNLGIVDNVNISGNIVASEDYVAGLVGNNGGGKIINSTSTCNITGKNYIGGITYNNYWGSIENSIFSGKITSTGGNKIGGIAARNYQTVSTVKNSYWDITKSGIYIGAAEGDGDLTKGMIGVKAEGNIEGNVGETLTSTIDFIGYENEVLLVNGNFSCDNKEIIDEIQSNKITNNKLEYKFNTNKEGNGSIIYSINVGEIKFNIGTNINIKSNFKKEDLNKDGIIDINDLALVSLKYNLKSTDENWNKEFDINNDNIIDIFDFVIISKSID